MRYKVMIAWLAGLSLAVVAQARSPSLDIVRETLRSSLAPNGSTSTSPDELTYHGAWAFSPDGQAWAKEQQDGKRWNAMVEGCRLRLKAALMEHGWDVEDGSMMAPAIPAATSYNLAAHREGCTLHLYVSIFPGEKSAWIAYVQTETKE